MFLDDRIGSIEVGKDADIAVWDRNMYTMPRGQPEGSQMRADAGCRPHRARHTVDEGQPPAAADDVRCSLLVSQCR